MKTFLFDSGNTASVNVSKNSVELTYNYDTRVKNLISSNDEDELDGVSLFFVWLETVNNGSTSFAKELFKQEKEEVYNYLLNHVK